MAAGALDTQGVWQYGEDDPLSPFSTFMNLLAASVSTQLAAKAIGIPAGGLVTINAASATTTASILTTPLDVTGLAVTINAPAGRRYKLVFDGPLASSVASDTRAQFGFREGSTLLDYDQSFVFSNAGHAHACHFETFVTPTAGPHTYKFAIGRLNGTGAVNVPAGASVVAKVYAEDIGPNR